MRAQQLPSSAGWRWLFAGVALYRRNPLVYSSLVVAYWVTVVFLNVLPIVGPVASALVVPGLSVGLMQAARQLERGLPINLGTLYGSLRENAKTLMLLGGLYLLVSLGILGISALFDGGDLFRYMLAGNRVERAAAEEGNFVLSSLVVMLLLVPVLMAWWFAPVLAAWHRLSAGKSLFFSLAACAMNWRPFLTYSLAVLVWALFLPGLFFGVLLLAMPDVMEVVLSVLIVPLVLILAPIIFASFYASYRDIFGISEIV